MGLVVVVVGRTIGRGGGRPTAKQSLTATPGKIEERRMKRYPGGFLILFLDKKRIVSRLPMRKLALK
jgi:hypothetical protein